MSPKNKPYIFGSVYELLDQRDTIIHYLCGLVPEIPKPTLPPYKKITPTSKPLQKITVTPLGKLPITTTTPWTQTVTEYTTTPPCNKTMDLVFIIEGSNKVGETNFNKTKRFLIKVLEKMDISEDTIHITIIQFSFTINIEYSFKGYQSKQDVIHKIKEIEFRGGNATNIGTAINYVIEHTFTTENGSRDLVPHLVYMVSSNPPTDVITKVPDDIGIIPITVGPSIDIHQLELIANTQDQIISIEDFDKLITDVPELVLERCCAKISLSTTQPSFTTTQTQPPVARVIPADYCSKPMDVMFILDGSSHVTKSQFEEMKTFVKGFAKINTGTDATQVSVLQYGWTNVLEVAWTDPQDKADILQAVDRIDKREEGSGKVGEALIFAVQTVTSEVHGARPDSTKIAVMVITDKSEDPVEEAAQIAISNRLTVFPIGVGHGYDYKELVKLAGPSANKKITRLENIEDLPTMVTLSDEFIVKLCTEYETVCIDEEGNERKPGDKWLLPDNCHSVTCLPQGKTALESHKVNCEKIPKPTCHNNLPVLKVEETCGCRWTCPCMCMGSSSRHIVTFDGRDFKLIGNCSYMLFQDKAHDVKIILQNGECNSASHQTCMNHVEVIHKDFSIQLSSDMKVTVNGEAISTPYVNGIFEITLYGAIVHELKIPKLGFIFTFTPSNNEFLLQLTPSAFSSRTSGLCGVCDQNTMNDFTLKNGSVTSDNQLFIKDWTVGDRPCETKAEEACTQPISPECHILLSNTFEQCHPTFPPKAYFKVCEEASCHGQDICEVISAYSHVCRINGVCVDWRTSDFCPMECPPSMVYHHCHSGCNKECGKPLNETQCLDSSTEGCFCAEGDVMLGGKCASERVCSECIDHFGDKHQISETWIPPNDPCSICICLENRMINCTALPCSTVEPITCGPCEISRLKSTSNRCCPDYECVCDQSNCDVTPVPHCENGLVPVLSNPGECKATYECACRREECIDDKSLICSSHKKLVRQKTECCDKYECVCSCTNSTVICPTGYSSSTTVNDCGCTSITCIPDKVCVHTNNIRPVGSTWEEGCKSCTCTSDVDSISGLHVSECVLKPCNTNCGKGFTYVEQKDECCGKCKKTVCEQRINPRGQGDIDFQERVRWYNVGAMWDSPTNPCIINECIQVNDEVFVLEKNVSCTDIHTSKCPTGNELICMQGTECCPICQCEPIPGCSYNGSIIAPNKGIMVDECSSCECAMSRGPVMGYKLTCRKTTCQPCPENYKVKKIEGSCCGKCVATSCMVKLKNGKTINVKPNETVTDGCDSHSCKINSLGELTWEKKITNCPPFNREKCLADGGQIKQLNNTCCETCAERECKHATGVIKKVQVDDCTSEGQINVRYCEGKCTSKSSYSTGTHKLEDQCICCAATQTESKIIQLRCTNGTIIDHEIQQATNCECLSRHCAK